MHGPCCPQRRPHPLLGDSHGIADTQLAQPLSKSGQYKMRQHIEGKIGQQLLFHIAGTAGHGGLSWQAVRLDKRHGCHFDSLVYPAMDPRTSACPSALERPRPAKTGHITPSHTEKHAWDSQADIYYQFTTSTHTLQYNSVLGCRHAAIHYPYI